MRILLELPDNTVSIKYCTNDGGSYTKERTVTLGMVVGVEHPVMMSAQPEKSDE